MALYSIDHLKQMKLGNIVHVAICNDENGYNENTDMYTLTKSENEAERPDWQVLGQVEEFAHKSSTEDDAVKYFGVKTKTATEDKNTKVTSDVMTAKVIDWSELIWRLKYRITGKLEAGKFTRMFATSEPTLRAWLLIEKYDDNQNLICTQFVYGKLRVSSEDNEDTKLVRPTLELQTIPSEYTGIVPLEPLLNPAPAPSLGGE